MDSTPALAPATPPPSGTNLNYNDASGQYLGTVQGTARSPSINLTNAPSGTLTFWCDYQTETTGTSYDQRWIRIFNASSGTQLYQGQFAGSGGAISCPAMTTWHQHTIDMSPYVGSPIQIEFFFNSVDSVGNNYFGWAIDDLQLITPDVTPPAAIDDLVADQATLTGMRLTWSSPFDDDVSGVAASFDLRFSKTAITEANFAQATQVSGEPAPSVPGTVHTMTLANLEPGTVYYFAIKSTDVAGNVSAISNVEVKSTVAPPPTSKGGGAGGKSVDRYHNCSAGLAADPTGLMVLAGILGLAWGTRATRRKNKS
ncbi:MAG TPA: fibronectin type III domain-containing protein [Planctomycetota bacterium]|nr:fibronectin type III domain-containing protein [Planctomycetota bacterium]